MRGIPPLAPFRPSREGDYARRRDEFVAWARTVPALVNPADVVAWNTDKRYLGQLAAAGAPVVHTDYVTPGFLWKDSAFYADGTVTQPAFRRVRPSKPHSVARSRGRSSRS